MVFHYFVSSRNGFGRKTKGKLLENQSQPTPGPLRSFLLGLSLLRLFSFTRKGEGRIRSGEFWTYSGPLLSLFLLLSLLWGSFSGTSPEAGSGPLLALSPFTRNKEEIRLWGLSGASFWPLPPLSFLFHALRKVENAVWAALDLLWASLFFIFPFSNET